MHPNEREIIIEHALKKENLEVALDIISSAQEIRSRIIKPFLKELQVFICKKLDMSQLDMSQWDWKTELDYTSHGNISLRFGVSNKNEPVSILLKSSGKVIYIGVFSSSNIWSHESINRLRSKLDRFGSSEDQWNQSEWLWIWYQSLESPNCWDYKDWTNKGTLIKMKHTDRKRVVKDIGNRLLEIIKMAKPVIEKWVKQNPSAQ